MSSGQTDNASNQVDYTIHKLVEKLTFQYAFYNLSGLKIGAFVMNAGTSDIMTKKMFTPKTGVTYRLLEHFPTSPCLTLMETQFQTKI